MRLATPHLHHGVCILAFLSISGLFIAATPAISAQRYFVSPTGTGKACTLQAPCLPQTAQGFVRLKPQNLNSDIDIIFMPGTYNAALPTMGGVSNKGIALTKADSGKGKCTNNRPCIVRYVSADKIGLRVPQSVISGGLTLTGKVNAAGL